jgi:hypothetical protein
MRHQGQRDRHRAKSIARFAMVLMTLALLQAPSRARAEESILHALPFVPTTMGEDGRSFATHGAQRVEVIADRREYWADDETGQALVVFLGVVPSKGDANLSLEITLRSVAADSPLARVHVPQVQSPKLPVRFEVSGLALGEYALEATLREAGGQPRAQAATRFRRSDRRLDRLPFPEQGVVLHVAPQSHLPQGEWPISTGIPMPKASLHRLEELSLSENGRPVPAQFSVRSTWSPGGAIQWVGLDFLARYDDGRPREYRLHRSASPVPAQAIAAGGSPLVVSRGNQVVLDTGRIRLQMGRPFAGFERVWCDRNGDGHYSDDELVVSGAGGPYIVDQHGTRYQANRNANAQVEVEDAGPVRATIAARGFYVSDQGKELCQFVIRITAFAGQPFVHLSHRMVNTIQDHNDDRRIADCGFEVALAQDAKRWRWGADEAEQSLIADGGVEPAFLHQDRADHYRVMRGNQLLTQGRRSDGWSSAQGEHGSVTLFLRDMFQKFPKELSFTGSRMTVHFWPRHGHVVFDEGQEVARDQIYKVRWAHQGPWLDFLIPQHYHDALVAFHKTENWATGSELETNRAGRSKMQISGGQGVVLGNDVVLWFDGDLPGADALRARAALIQQDPHALAEPAWNTATEVYGSLAPRDPAKFAPVERLLDHAYDFYQRAIIDGGDDYGQWIYGGVHSAWLPDKNAAQLTRVWQMSHYQNVFAAWLLYFRSAQPQHVQWARVHSNQHLDVGVTNYLRVPDTHSYAHLGDIGGNVLHCKGFMPWAGDGSTGGHWIDIANYFARYYMTGDRRGLDLADRWFTTRGVFKGVKANVVPTDPEGFVSQAKLAEAAAYLKAHPNLEPAQIPEWIVRERNKPRRQTSREFLVPLGEMTQYYQATWNPQALLALRDLAEELNGPIDDGLADFGKHWHEWYYALSRDERVVRQVRSLLEQQRAPGGQPPAPISLAAFLYHATGDASYLASSIPGTLAGALNIYECPGDRFDGYNLAVSNPGAMVLGRLPYYLDALDRAGLRLDSEPATMMLPTRGGRYDAADKALMPPRGWSNTGITVLARAAAPTPLAVRLDPARGYGGFGGHYQMLYGWPRLSAAGRTWDEQQRMNPALHEAVPFVNKDTFHPTPGERRFGPSMRFPDLQLAANDPERLEVRLEVGGSGIALPTIVDARSGEPIPQIAVLAATQFTNMTARETPWSQQGLTDLWVRPLDSAATVTVEIRSEHLKAGGPTTLQVSDANSRVIADLSVLPIGLRSSASLTLDPREHPMPWRWRITGAGGAAFRVRGVPELFLARRRSDFDLLLPRLAVEP